MSESTELVVVDQTNALTLFKSSSEVEKIIKEIEDKVNAIVPDVTSVKGRKSIASVANKVAKAKTYLDDMGKEVVTELKKMPVVIDGNRRLIRERLDELKKTYRKPLTDWEKEQDRLRLEEEAKIAAAKLAKEIEEAWEFAILLNDKFDHDKLEAEKEAERLRVEYEQELRRQAAEQARLQAEADARAIVDTANRAAQEAKEALEKSEREQQERIKQLELANKRAIEETKRQIEAEAQRKQAEETRRAQDIEHRRKINREIVQAFTKDDMMSETLAMEVVKTILAGNIPHTSINY